MNNKNVEINDLRIVFMGTPEFAVESLKILIEHSYNVVAVITAPDKPSGRGKKIKPSPVKQYALENSIKVLQPEKLKNDDFLTELKNLEPNLFVVVAFRMLPKEVWQIPDYGTFNLHASLLPHYRGAAPINWVVINGEKETGVTTFYIDEAIDTGGIIMQEKIQLEEKETAGTLHDKLMIIGSKLVLKTVKRISTEGKLKVIPQSDLLKPEGLTQSELKPATKIFKEDCEINWLEPIHDIINKIRGLSPYPGAFTNLVKEENGEPVICKIFQAEKSLYKSKRKTKGNIITDGKSYIHVIINDIECMSINELQLAGKKRMTTNEFLRGFHDNLEEYSFK